MGLLQKERVLTYPDTPNTILTQRSTYKLTAELPPMEYAPQQWNGVAERKNRMIMEATREMFHDQDLPMHL